MRNLPKLYNETEHYCWYDSPIGILKIAEDDQGITEVSFQEEIGADQKEGSLYLEKTLRQLEEYFAGIRRSFDVPLSLKGTEFQKKVWHALKEIPYGHTACYQEVAAMIGNEKASRAIGNANHHNQSLVYSHNWINTHNVPYTRIFIHCILNIYLQCIYATCFKIFT